MPRAKTASKIVPFGIHGGKPLKDVPVDYLLWLAKESEHASRALKSAAMKEHRRRGRKGLKKPPASYRLPFGEHRDIPLKRIPRAYLEWIVSPKCSEADDETKSTVGAYLWATRSARAPYAEPKRQSPPKPRVCECSSCGHKSKYGLSRMRSTNKPRCERCGGPMNLKHEV